MSFSENDLHTIARLANLDVDSQDVTTLGQEVKAIIDFVQQLQAIETQHVAPLFHPLDRPQRFREDHVSEKSCLKELKELAPFFDQQLYMVPKVIETD